MQGGTPCEYSDRDRYHLERGVSLSDSITPLAPQSQPYTDPLLEPSKPKRRRLSYAASSDGPRPQSPFDSRGFNSFHHVSTAPTSHGVVDDIGGAIPSQIISGTSPSSIVNGSPAGPLKRILVPFFR